MNTLRSRTLSALLVALAVTPALADSDVDATNKFSWSENCGWMNWRDAGSPQASQGVALDASGRFLSGSVWFENVGYVNLGDGTPADGSAYANTTGADFGVNVNMATGHLSGMAWGENIGWLNFSGGSLAGGNAKAARLSLTSPRRLQGYVWAENIGWINLDLADEGKFVELARGGRCNDIDFNNDGLFPDDNDLIDLLTVLAGGVCSTAPTPGCDSIDFNNDDLFPDDNDLIDYLTVLAGGTPTNCTP